jgi:3-methyladenine DNA glycosylase AlkD
MNRTLAKLNSAALFTKKAKTPFNMKISNPHHKEILESIKELSSPDHEHTFPEGYLGTSHPCYPINAPTLRKIAKEWMGDHRDLSSSDLEKLLTSLIGGQSATEKIMAGVLMDASTKTQRKFDPNVFDKWLGQLEGWAEIDSVCTGQFTVTEIPANLKLWKPILIQFSKNKNISKRRASLVLLCSPVRKVYDPALATLAFQVITRLEKEKSILITKAISWLLRSLVKLYKSEVAAFVNEHEGTLPKIAVRETRVKLLTGRKIVKVGRS